MPPQRLGLVDALPFKGLLERTVQCHVVNHPRKLMEVGPSDKRGASDVRQSRVRALRQGRSAIEPLAPFGRARVNHQIRIVG